MDTNRTSEVPVLENRIAELERDNERLGKLYNVLGWECAAWDEKWHQQYDRIAELDSRIADLEASEGRLYRQNTDLQARNTQLVEKNRRLMLVTQGKLDEALS